MIGRIEKYFLSKYNNSDYIIRVKTRMWFYVMILMFFLSVIIYASLTVFNLIPMMIWHITIPSMMLVPMCSLYLVKKGYNFASADLFFVILSIVTLLGMYFRYSRNPAEIYMTTFYLVTVVILGASVFCRVYWVYVYTTVFFISNIIILIFTIIDKHAQLTAVFKQSFLYSILSLIFTFLLSLFIRITTNRALKSVQEELEKNINLNKDLGEKHGIFQEVAGRLEQHFNVLKTSSADFEDSSQNTAASIEEISSTAEEVMSGVEQVFDVINEQYHGLMVLLNKMEELSGITAGISEQIQKVSRSTEEVTSMAQEGTEVLKQMHSGMSRVSESAQIMENIVLIINDIADKINLLSLNASIEAARAGVTGRGFAVVAEEISKLGAMTQSSMLEINKLIHSSSNDINSGLKRVDETVSTMSKIIDTINGIIIEIRNISMKTETQQDINTAVNTESDNLKIKSEQIKDMMNMQQAALNEIARSIVGINDIAQFYVEGSRRLHNDAEKVERLAEMLKGDGDKELYQV